MMGVSLRLVLEEILMSNVEVGISSIPMAIFAMQVCFLINFECAVCIADSIA